MTPADLSERLLNFAVKCGKLADKLPDTRLGRHIAGQLIGCSTSPAPNYEEACAAESKADFIHKLRICLKELRESGVWLRMNLKANLLAERDVIDLLKESLDLSNIIGQSIVTARASQAKRS